MVNNLNHRGHFRELGKDFLFYGFMSALSQMSGIILLPLFTRIFAVDEYGLIDIIAVFVSLTSILMGMALSNTVLRYYFTFSEETERKRYVSTLFLASLAFSVLILAILMLFSKVIAKEITGSTDNSAIIQLGIFIALINSLVSIPNTILRLERRIIAYNSLSFLKTLLYVFLALYFVLIIKSGTIGVFVSQLIAASLVLLLSLVITFHNFTFQFSIIYLKQALSYSLPLLPSLLGTWVNSQVDRFILLLVNGLGGVAIYGAASRISNLIIFLLQVFQQGWNPYAMQIINSHDRNDIYRRMLNYYSGFFSILALILISFSPEVFEFFLPGEYHKGYVLLPWLLGSAMFHTSSSLTKLGVIVSEKTFYISKASIINVILNFILAYILIFYFGVAGAAIGSFLTQLIFTGSLIRYSYNKSEVRFDIKTLLIVLITYISCSVLIIVIPDMINNPTSILIRTLSLLLAIGIISFHVIDMAALRLIERLIRKFSPGMFKYNGS